MKTMFACALVIAGASVAGCATQPPVQMTWIRTDGKNMKGDPVLVQQFEVDRSVCVGDTSKAGLAGLNPVTPYKADYSGAVAAERTNLSANVMRGCMAEKGYVFVREDEAEARSAQFAAVRPQQNNRPLPASARQRALKSQTLHGKWTTTNSDFCLTTSGSPSRS
jgi:hypothetical protein